LLADPLKLRILAEFVAEPRTTMQVAERLGEPAPKLYRHVDALVRAGMLKRMGERKKRGTTERYLQAVAARFEVDRSLFGSSQRGAPKTAALRELEGIVKTVLADTEREFLELCADGMPEGDDGPMMLRLKVRGSREHVAEIRRKLTDWIAEGGRDDGADPADVVEYSGMIAFYHTGGTPRSEEQG
jgi:DNA-binding transcriptional ArsR family regulator